MGKIFDYLNWRRQSSRITLDLDEIFLDSRNLPSFDNQQFEGRIEKPISKQAIWGTIGTFLIICLVFAGRIGFIQVVEGKDYATRSNQNRLRHTLVFADRGIIYDRTGEALAWNNPKREYIESGGFAHVLGYIGYPNELELKDGDFNPKEYIGKNGVENTFNSILMGERGVRIEEVDASGRVESDHVSKVPTPGESITLSIDARVQAKLYEIISEVATSNGFKGGAAVLMNVETGEVLSLVSFPEFDMNVMAAGKDRVLINEYVTNPDNPFLNRVVSGLYSPGSTIKPYLGLAALVENIISPTKTIYSSGRLVVPNPYFPDQPSIFNDNKAHGAVDLRRALAVSSNVYFYTIGGGAGGQPGLGISRIEKYSRLAGFGAPTGIELNVEAAGVIPNPEWKAKTFNGEPWRLGDTYHTSIGQYGYLVTPLQVVRAVSYLANNGRLLQPTLVARAEPKVINQSNFSATHFKVIQEAMRQTVTNGTALVLNSPAVEVAAKSGTAEVDASKRYVNAWISGYFPYGRPRYAFVVVMEQGPRGVSAGGGVVMRRLIDWMVIYTPEYLN